MADRERLIDLMIEAKRTDPETGSFTDFCPNCGAKMDGDKK